MRKVGNQLSPHAVSFSEADGVTATAASEATAPITYQSTWTLENANTASKSVSVSLSDVPQADAVTQWTLSFWAKAEGNVRLVLYAPSVGVKTTTLPADGRWHYISKTFSYDGSYDLTKATAAFSLATGATAQLNGIQIVPGSTPLANESYQNSAALKNNSVCNNRFCFAARLCGSHNRVAAQPSVLAESAPGGARYSVPSTRAR